MWTHDVDLVPLTAVGDPLLIPEKDGRLCVAEAAPSGYGERSSFELPKPPMAPNVTWTPPVLYRGRIYCRSLGELFCIEARQ